MLNTLRNFFSRTTPSPLEQLCLDSWRASLADDAKGILDSQLALVRLVQRQAGGAKLCFYYRDGEPSALLHPDRVDLHAATVVLKKPGGTTAQVMRVKVYVHRGRFFSIEFPKRPERYAELHDMDLKVLQLAHVETHEALTPAR
jgi:hypothetical protein